MPHIKLIADSGATKTEWCLLNGKNKKMISTQGISPYFLKSDEIVELLRLELLPQLNNTLVNVVHYYGTGCHTTANSRIVKNALKKLFPKAGISVDHDLTGAAKALCGDQKGIACILGTGSNSCYYNGKKIIRNSPGLGFILGDEGSGAYLGKKVLQYFLYNTYDEDLRARFDARFVTTEREILHAVYKAPWPNRYLSSFAIFLAENRGHYMIENIIEDGLNDFFFNHIYKYRESWKLPIHFVGSVAYGFKDVLEVLCKAYQLELGKVIKNPMVELIEYHAGNK